MSRAKRVRARDHLKSLGILSLGGREFSRYLERMKSAVHDKELGFWTCLDNEPDPRRPNLGRPRVRS